MYLKYALNYFRHIHAKIFSVFVTSYRIWPQ